MQREKKDRDKKSAGEDKPATSSAPAQRAAIETDKVCDEQAEAKRKNRCRKMLSATTNTPAWLLETFPMPEDVILTHVQHKGGVLPHFQVRMVGGDSFENKHQGCISNFVFCLAAEIGNK